MKCRDCENLIWSYDEGEWIWHCRECYCPDLDIERDCPDFAPKKPDIFTALSTLQAELEQVKRERDAIGQDFRAFTKQWWEQDSGFPCRWCKSENFGGCEWKAKHPGEICAGRAFEWRGPQKED